jgi:hypothetical protein
VNAELAENRHPKVHANNVTAEQETIITKYFNEIKFNKNQIPKTKNQIA